MTDCNCDMRTKLVGDGCSICNPDMAEKIALDNFFADDVEYRQLQFGEKIEEGDVFYCDGKVHRATDVGNGVVTSHHFNHYRIES